MRIGKTRTLSRSRCAMSCRTSSSFIVGLALEDDKLLRVTGSNDLVDKSVDVIDTPTQSSICSRLFASPRSYERMDSPSMRLFASEKNGSGLTAMTSNGRRWRRTDCFKNRRTALDRSSPARANSSSASCLKSESTRICNVDVVILKSFVVQHADSMPNYCGKRNGMHSRFLNSKTKGTKT